MKLKMAENSLFAILLRSSWWISIAIAAGLIVAAAALLPPDYSHFGVVVALPFIVIGAIAGWKQLQAPSPARIAGTIDTVRAMGWNEFAEAIEAAFRADGYVVTRLAGQAADFEMQKGGRTVLLAGKRWKVARTGIEPLRELVAAGQECDARECLYVATGELTDNARRFAAQNRIRILSGPELARLMPAAGRAAKKGKA
ncbi:MAG: restriction endonuclease [Pseudomonadota bacterium]|nr:restriction endonuclease [Pseudomonadota bacterium]